MRLFLLPVSTRRTLLYAQRLSITTKEQAKGSYADKATSFAARTWAGWEKKESGWQRKVTDYGNHALRRIAFQEWGLKSVPPLSARRQQEELQDGGKVELVFPGTVIPPDTAEAVAHMLSTERQALHRKRMLWCFVGMPITIPFALVPVIPNLPFFYLVYRAWSHYRALAGGKHIQWLIKNKLLISSPSKTLDQLYSTNAHRLADADRPAAKERVLLTHEQIRNFSDTLAVPGLETELDRAVWQVQQELDKEETQKKEADAIKATAQEEKPDSKDSASSADDKKSQ